MALENNTDIVDLIALAASNKAAALSAFQREYESIPFVLTSNIHIRATNLVDLIEDKIFIKSYNFFKKLMNIFGHLVKEIRVEISEFTKFKLATVAKYVSQHCTTLKVLRFTYDEDAGLFESNVDRADVMAKNPLLITKPFPSVESFHVDNVYVKTHLKMDVCFPNLKSLDLLSVVTSDPSLFEVHMEKLKHIEVGMHLEEFDDEFDDDDVEMFQLERRNVEKIIGLNRHLESVAIGMEMDIPFIEFLRDNLPSLRELELSEFEHDDYNGADIVFNSVETVEVDLTESKTMPPIASESLTELAITAGDNKTALEYIKKNRSIKKLLLTCEYNGAEVLEMIAGLPHLVSLFLTVPGKKLAASNVIRLLTECEHLDEAQFMIGVKCKRQRWLARFQNRWEIGIEYYTGCYVFRKIASN